MTARLESLEIGLSGHWTVPEVTACAEAAERWGFGRFWLAENYYARSLSILAAAVCAATRRIDVGLGLYNPYTRLAPLIAMEAATLDELSGGRITLALGAGKTPGAHLGIDQSRSVTTLRESLEICRRLLAGETLGYAGAAHRIAPGAVTLGVRGPRGGALPIYFGAMGPKLLRLAGERADGAFLSVFTTPAMVRHLRPHLEAGLRQSGRTLADIYFGTYAVFAVDADGRVARDLVKPTVANYLGRQIPLERLAAAGIDPEWAGDVRAAVQAAHARGGLAEAVRFVPDALCERLAVCGTPEECCAGLQALAEAGVRTVAAYNVLGRDPVEAIRLIAGQLVPAVCSAREA